jgi:hypothetical protein
VQAQREIERERKEETKERRNEREERKRRMRKMMMGIRLLGLGQIAG